MTEVVFGNLLAEAVHPRSEGEPGARSWEAFLPHIGARIQEAYGWRILRSQEAFLQAVTGHDILNVAGTGSGKTESSIFLICEAVQKRAGGMEPSEGDPFASAGRVALYLFPNNALLVDQEARFRAHNAALMEDRLRIVRYTRELDLEARRQVRAAAGRGEVDILLMTLHMWKDTLYSALVRGEAGWVRALASPWLLVCDELDYYAGYPLTFLFTLYRILKRYNAETTQMPVRVVFNSATIPNAEDLAQHVMADAVVIRGPARHGTIQLYAYGLDTGEVDAERGELTAFDPFLEGLQTGAIYAGKQVVIYADDKFLLEREAILKELEASNFGIVHGDLPWAEKRRMLEQFRGGHLRGLLVTRAVEAGLNFGQLELLIILGYPSGGKRGLHQLAMRVARRPEQVGEVYWFLTIKDWLDGYYLERPAKLQALLEELAPEPVGYRYFSEKILRSALLLCGALGLTQQDLRWLFPFTAPEYLEEKVTEVLTDYLAEGLVQRGRAAFQLHLSESEEVFFSMSLTTALREVRVKTVEGALIGVIDIEKVAQTALPGDYLILGRRVWRVVGLRPEEVRVEAAQEAYYSRNLVDKVVRKGRGSSTWVRGVFAWYGEVDVLLKPKVQVLRELQTHARVRRRGDPSAEHHALYWTEGVTLRFRHHRMTLQECLHLGAGLLRAAQAVLGVDPGEMEVRPLHDARRREQVLLLMDRGAATGAARQVFDHLGAVLEETQQRLTRCSCGGYCEECVWLRGLARGYSRRTHLRLGQVLRHHL